MQATSNIIFQSETGPRALRSVRGPWRIFSVLNSADGEIAKAELAGGAEGLVLTTLESVAALRDLPLHTFSIRNEAGDAAARALTELVSQQPIDPARLDISFGLQDIRLAAEFEALGFIGPFHEARSDAGDAASEMSDILHSRAGATVSLSADHSMFATLAKFRAMRILWERLYPSIAFKLHAVVRAPAGDDHEHYMLRCVAACFGAGLGGADSIAITPFKNDGVFERRMVRNVQNILLRESHLGDVADAAAGSGYVEHLTRELCDAAWKQYQS